MLDRWALQGSEQGVVGCRFPKSKSHQTILTWAVCVCVCVHAARGMVQRTRKSIASFAIVVLRFPVGWPVAIWYGSNAKRGEIFGNGMLY